MDGLLGWVAAAVSGVVMFAVSGAFFARVADLTEDARTRQLPAVLLPRPQEAPVIGGPRVRPGWIYQDAAGCWYLGVGSWDDDPAPLLRLPEFVLAEPDEPEYPLSPVGPGELSVLAPDEHADLDAQGEESDADDPDPASGHPPMALSSGDPASDTTAQATDPASRTGTGPAAGSEPLPEPRPASAAERQADVHH